VPVLLVFSLKEELFCAFSVALLLEVAFEIPLAEEVLAGLSTDTANGCLDTDLGRMGKVGGNGSMQIAHCSSPNFRANAVAWSRSCKLTHSEK
jgi:hypothetical protein